MNNATLELLLDLLRLYWQTTLTDELFASCCCIQDDIEIRLGEIKERAIKEIKEIKK